jgi:hypothetical protein
VDLRDNGLMADRRYLKKMTRYWAAEEARATVALQDALASEWFDYWHTHLDWKGRGNRHGSDRTAVAAALLRLLERAVACRRQDTQCWVVLAPDSGQSALFLHSPNPQGTPWPHPFDGVTWDIEAPDWLAPVMAPHHQLGRWGSAEPRLLVRVRA